MSTTNPTESSEFSEFSDEREVMARAHPFEDIELVPESDRPYDHSGSRPLMSGSLEEDTRGRHGEMVAVLALVLPLVAEGVLLACRFSSLEIELGLSWGMIVVTALLLTVDAARLGRIDRDGISHCGPGTVFLGLIFLWIVCYPVTYFRRRHFGRPNFGPLAILVAVFCAVAPFVQQFLAFGILGNDPPTCNSREVINMVDDQIRENPLCLDIVSVSGHREMSYDRAKQMRIGQCLVKTKAETMTVTYTIKIANRQKGMFSVLVDPFYPIDPPACENPSVIATLDRLIRDAAHGRFVLAVTAHEEVQYDRETKTRYGRCRVIMRGWRGDVGYRVYWLDQKTGYFQVELEQ